MLILAENAGEAITSMDVQVGEPVRVGDRFGRGASGRAFAMPWCGLCWL
jgi:hypothetical protein